MKQIISIFLVFILSWQFVYKTGYAIYWKINQDIIAARYCENKAKPILQCNGKCRLAKQLQKVDTIKTEENTIPVEVLKLKSVDYFVLESQGYHLKQLQLKWCKKLFFFKNKLLDCNGYLNNQDRPPEFV